MSMKATIQRLETALAESKAEAKAFLDQSAAVRGELAEQKDINKQLRAKFDDLKERIVTAESENQRMRGYIQRVQEDDGVREELVMTGDPQGEQRLVPKRKHTSFSAPNPTSGVGEIDPSYHYDSFSRNEPRRKPVHWVRY